MSILGISILACTALCIGRIPRPQIRNSLLLIASIFVVYWLQSRSIGIYSITFWLPTATILLAVLSWAFTASPETRSLRENWPGMLIIAFSVLALDLTRYMGKTNLFFGEINIPVPGEILLALGLAVLVVLLVLRISPLKRFTIPTMLVLFIGAFIFLKVPGLNRFLYETIGEYTDSPLIENGTFAWLGFSYFAFRIIHTLRDRQNGLLPAVTLSEYVTYVIFFPAFIAGPIDRVERFVKDLRVQNPLTDEDWYFAGQRFLVGLFKKFVVADALAVFALNPGIAPQIRSTGWFWVLLYAYSFQIYFDFSGYTDIAIGIARVAGIKLPENFNAPYLKPNLTLFWNSWHITLAQWFRAYYFNPLQRYLRSPRLKIPTGLLVFGLQVSTMTLIGLWHGMTLNFIAWGVWHGVGLFIHNRWKETAGRRISAWATTRFRKSVLEISGIILTFDFVTVGWVFFLLPVSQIPAGMRLLFGLM